MKILKLFSTILFVGLMCSCVLSCGDEGIEEDNTPSTNKKSLVGTWKDVDDGDVYRLIFYSNGTGKRTYNNKTVFEDGYGSSLGTFKWAMTSSTTFMVVFDESYISVDGTYMGGNSLTFSSSIYFREK